MSRSAFQSAYSNSLGICACVDALQARYGNDADAPCPEGESDPLELYGVYRQALEDPEAERRWLQEYLAEHSLASVWERRAWLVAERLFLQTF